MKPASRRVLGITAAVALAAVVTFVGFRAWYFAEHIHREAVSPDGRTRVVVTKRMAWSPQPLIVGLRIGTEQGLGPETEVDSADIWTDVEERSYPVRWIAPDVLQVGTREGEFRGDDGTFRVEGEAVVRVDR